MTILGVILESTETVGVLELPEKEAAVLLLLGNDKLSVQELDRRQPLTSKKIVSSQLYTLLAKLAARGFVRKIDPTAKSLTDKQGALFSSAFKAVKEIPTIKTLKV